MIKNPLNIPREIENKINVREKLLKNLFDRQTNISNSLSTLREKFKNKNINSCEFKKKRKLLDSKYNDLKNQINILRKNIEILRNRQIINERGITPREIQKINKRLDEQRKNEEDTGEKLRKIWNKKKRPRYVGNKQMNRKEKNKEYIHWRKEQLKSPYGKTPWREKDTEVLKF